MASVTLPPRKLYRVGEILEYTSLSRQTVHNYTTMGLIREEKRTQGGHRLYAEDVFVRLARIEQLKKTMTLAQIRDLLARETPSRQAV